jgi:hypothetical protein
LHHAFHGILHGFNGSAVVMSQARAFDRVPRFVITVPMQATATPPLHAFQVKKSGRAGSVRQWPLMSLKAAIACAIKNSGPYQRPEA